MNAPPPVRTRPPKVLSDIFESLLAALLLSGGLELAPVADAVRRLLRPEGVRPDRVHVPALRRLYELCQARRLACRWQDAHVGPVGAGAGAGGGAPPPPSPGCLPPSVSRGAGPETACRPVAKSTGRGGGALSPSKAPAAPPKARAAPRKARAAPPKEPAAPPKAPAAPRKADAAAAPSKVPAAPPKARAASAAAASTPGPWESVLFLGEAEVQVARARGASVVAARVRAATAALKVMLGGGKLA